VIPVAFDYEVAESVEHALELLGATSGAKAMAGGHSLLPMMKLRFARPSTVVDIGRIDALDEIADEVDHVTVGALVRHCDLERNPIVRKEVPLLGFAAGLAGDRQVRHRGTIGGSLAHADPAGDLPAIALALRPAGPRPEDGRRRLVVREVPPALDRLGDGRRRSGRARERLDRRSPSEPGQHGPAAAARDRGGGRAARRSP